MQVNSLNITQGLLSELIANSNFKPTHKLTPYSYPFGQVSNLPYATLEQASLSEALIENLRFFTRHTFLGLSQHLLSNPSVAEESIEILPIDRLLLSQKNRGFYELPSVFSTLITSVKASTTPIETALKHLGEMTESSHSKHILSLNLENKAGTIPISELTSQRNDLHQTHKQRLSLPRIKLQPHENPSKKTTANIKNKASLGSLFSKALKMIKGLLSLIKRDASI